MEPALKYDPFDDRYVAENTKQLPATNGRPALDYVPGEFIISQLNRVFPGEWGFTIDQVIQADGEYVVTGRLTVMSEVCQAIHGDVGEDKTAAAAATNCLKRCARHLGNQFGLTLYSNEPQLAHPDQPHPAPQAHRTPVSAYDEPPPLTSSEANDFLDGLDDTPRTITRPAPTAAQKAKRCSKCDGWISEKVLQFSVEKWGYAECYNCQLKSGHARRRIDNYTGGREEAARPLE